MALKFKVGDRVRFDLTKIARHYGNPKARDFEMSDGRGLIVGISEVESPSQPYAVDWGKNFPGHQCHTYDAATRRETALTPMGHGWWTAEDCMLPDVTLSSLEAEIQEYLK